MRICPQCNSQLVLQSNICSVCALPFPENSLDYDYNEEEFEDDAQAVKDEKICPSCDKVNNATWAFCSFCGTSLSNIPIKKTTITKQKPYLEIDLEVKEKLKNNPENSPFTPINKLLATPEEKVTPPTKAVANSLEDLIFCIVCGQANHKNAEICVSCQNPTARTLAMGSQISYPKLRLMKDSGESETYDITGEEFTIGRTDGTVTFPEDNYMSSLHARIVCRDQRYFLLDEQSKNGVYKRLKSELILSNGNIILVGRQVFRFEK